MHVIWRFYMDARRQWHWQKIGPGYAVVAGSRKSHKEYEACLKDARGAGYVFEPPQGKHVEAQQA